MAWIPGVRGVLCDVDGTLLSGDRAIEGGPAMLRRLDAAAIAYRLTTNTTRRSRAAVAAALNSVGYRVEAHQVLNPAALARRRILDSGARRTALLVAPGAEVDFEGVDLVEHDPDWVVLGDLGEGFDWPLMQRAFVWIRGGARLMALQKNRFWDPGDGHMRIDAGAFIAGLEYAAEVTAELAGKPAPAFFEQALASLGLEATAVAVIGDDVQTDGAGAQACGCRALTVRTGKFSPDQLAAGDFTPDLLVDSVADLDPC
jgi:inorganic pyrophosphatase